MELKKDVYELRFESEVKRVGVFKQEGSFELFEQGCLGETVEEVEVLQMELKQESVGRGA